MMVFAVQTHSETISDGKRTESAGGVLFHCIRCIRELFFTVPNQELTGTLGIIDRQITCSIRVGFRCADKAIDSPIGCAGLALPQTQKRIPHLNFAAGRILVKLFDIRKTIDAVFFV